MIYINRQVITELKRYFLALCYDKRYKITRERAILKRDKLSDFIFNQIPNSISKGYNIGHICLYKDLGQRFINRQQNKLALPTLRRVNFKDESNTQWALSYAYYPQQDLLIINKLMLASQIREEYGQTKILEFMKRLTRWVCKINCVTQYFQFKTHRSGNAQRQGAGPPVPTSDKIRTT